MFTDVIAGVIFGGLTGIAIEVFAAVSAFAVDIAVLEIPVSTPLEEFIR